MKPACLAVGLLGMPLFYELIDAGEVAVLAFGVLWGLLAVPAALALDRRVLSRSRYDHLLALAAVLLGAVASQVAWTSWWYSLGPGVGDPKGWEVGAYISAIACAAFAVLTALGYGVALIVSKAARSLGAAEPTAAGRPRGPA